MIINHYFINRSISYPSLLEYGFIKKDNTYTYEASILDNHFKVIFTLTPTSKTSKIIDLQTNDEYILLNISTSLGSYASKVKTAYELILNDIITKCTTLSIFKSKNALNIIKYLKDTYQDELEYLWPKFPNNAIVRNKINKKWYLLIATISKDKLGFNSHEVVEIINVRYPKNKTSTIIDNKSIFPAYHMNKQSWITIVLDKISSAKVYALISQSYELSLLK